MKKRLLLLVFPAVALVLELLPKGVMMQFAVPPGEPPIIEYHPYFSLFPFGYGNFAPFPTALITLIVFITLAVYCKNGNYNLINLSRGFLCVGVLFSVIPFVLFGIKTLTLVGALITLSLAAGLFVLLFVKKSTETQKHTEVIK